MMEYRVKILYNEGISLDKRYKKLCYFLNMMIIKVMM